MSCMTPVTTLQRPLIDLQLPVPSPYLWQAHEDLAKNRLLSQVILRDHHTIIRLVAGTHQKKVFFGVQNNSRLVSADC
jgi:hypothetical protein